MGDLMSIELLHPVVSYLDVQRHIVLVSSSILKEREKKKKLDFKRP